MGGGAHWGICFDFKFLSKFESILEKRLQGMNLENGMTYLDGYNRGNKIVTLSF
jgi:hypothetical protein